ncbi:transmembrane protein 44 isoform X6 [Eleginops maclovinus]|uniref:transmembrane protein 44 isoform X6 n=1 Tax=Eleginops maclovinus TaxID=56733 RepID=UPI003080C13B
MEPRILTLDGQSGGNPNLFLFNLVEFCVDAVTTCFSRAADKLCVPIGLSSLSALLLLLSCILLVYQRCTFRVRNPGETIIFLYSLLGNLCSTSGAILSRQLYIQILLGAFAASMDAVSCISCCLPVLLCWNSKAEKRLRMIRGRRRQHLLAVCVLMVVAGGFLKSRVPDSVDGHLSGRRLMHATFQDNTEILGYILGLLSFVIACTSRFPALCRTTCLQKVTLSEVKDLPLNRTLRVIGGDSFCSSGTSCDSSPVSSDLEWDFEEANPPWRESTVNQQEGEEFQTQERPTNPKPFNFCTCAMFGFPQKCPSCRNENDMQL